MAAVLAGRSVLASSSVVAGRDQDAAQWHAYRAAETAQTDLGLEATFRGTGVVHEVRAVLLESLPRGNGVSARFRLDGWQSLRYVAVGRTVEGVFRHVKSPHTVQGDWTEISIGDDDLVMRIQNGWANAGEASAEDVRVYVSGTPAASGAKITVDWVAAWYAKGTEALGTWQRDARSESVLQALTTYLWQKNPTLEADVRRFLDWGTFPIVSGVDLPWPNEASLPTGLSDVSTYRYIWHSLYPAAYMLLYARRHGDTTARAAALRLVSDWLARSFYQVDPDQRYAWYDHGTAERLITLLLLRTTIDADNSDRRVRNQVDEAILAHGFLLESEAFYAANQRNRFHNHAWFQDLALLVAGALVPTPAAGRWMETGRRRLKQQIAQLVCTEGPYAVFVENSVGYHHGIQTLVEFAAELLDVVVEDSSLRETARGLAAWSARLRYADDRAPSTGDTFRRPTPAERPVAQHSAQDTGVVVLPRAGYAVAHGTNAGRPFTFCFFATSLSSTHKHADNLAITLFHDGVEWLIDPSFYSHEYDEPIPAYLRGPAAHSAPYVTGYHYSIEPGLAALDGGIEAGGDLRLLRAALGGIGPCCETYGQGPYGPARAHGD